MTTDKRVLSNAERQKKYRNSQQFKSARINTVIDTNASEDLKRLARHHNLTQRKMLEQLIRDAAVRTQEQFEAGAKSDQEFQRLQDAWCEPV